MGREPNGESVCVCVSACMSRSVCVCCSETPHRVWRVVRTFRDAVSAAETLINDGVVEKVWVLGGVRVFQVMMSASTLLMVLI